MLSAAAVMLIVSGAFACTKKEVYTTASSNVQLTQLSKEFKDLPATIPGTIAVQKNLHVYKDAADDDQIINSYTVSLSGKGFDEKATYDKNGLLLNYKDKLKALHYLLPLQKLL